jgi:hypothetical protein
MASSQIRWNHQVAHIPEMILPREMAHIVACSIAHLRRSLPAACPLVGKARSGYLKSLAIQIPRPCITWGLAYLMWLDFAHDKGWDGLRRVCLLKGGSTNVSTTVAVFFNSSCFPVALGRGEKTLRLRREMGFHSQWCIVCACMCLLSRFHSC